MKNTNFPEIEKNQFALTQIEASTGISLNTLGEYYLKSSSNEQYQLFESKEEAINFVNRHNRRNIIYMLFDYNGEVVYEKEIYGQEVEKVIKPWWKFW